MHVRAFSAGQGSAFLYMENEQHTLPRMRAADISVKNCSLENALLFFLICVMKLFILFGFSTLMFGLDWGDLLGFAAISACVAFSVTGLGTLLMVLVYRAGNPNIGNVFQAVIVQVMALFRG